jgi:hypothetical protein
MTQNSLYTVIKNIDSKFISSLRRPLIILITRFCLGTENSIWCEIRLKIFKEITLKSLKNQSSQKFIWIIFVDNNLPKKILSQFLASLSDNVNVYVISVNLDYPATIPLGSMHGLNEILNNLMLEEQIIENIGEYYVTGILDDDDALHCNTFELIEVEVSNLMPAMFAHKNEDFLGSPTLGHFIAHSDGVILCFPKGQLYSAQNGTTTDFTYPFMSCSCFVLTRYSSSISVLNSRHGRWQEFANCLGFLNIQLELDEPAWLYTQHNFNLSSSERGNEFLYIKGDHELILSRFGIDINRTSLLFEEINTTLKLNRISIKDVRAHSNKIHGLRMLITCLQREKIILSRKLTKATDNQKNIISNKLQIINSKIKMMTSERKKLASRIPGE